MSLKEAVAQRRAEEAVTCSRAPSLKEALLEQRSSEKWASQSSLYSTKEDATSLLVEASGDKIWLLPWNHFILAHHQDEGECERLVLTFVANEVTISGLNLGILIPEIAHQRLENVRAAPGKYLKSSEKEPFIEKIQVHSLEDKKVTESY